MTTAPTPEPLDESILIALDPLELEHFCHALEVSRVVFSSTSDSYRVAAQVLRSLGRRPPVGGDDEPTEEGSPDDRPGTLTKNPTPQRGGRGAHRPLLPTP